jgi:hypothetical protein
LQLVAAAVAVEPDQMVPIQILAPAAVAPVELLLRLPFQPVVVQQLR